MTEETYRRVLVSLERAAAQLEHLYDSQRDALTATLSVQPFETRAQEESYWSARSRAWGEVNGLYAARQLVLNEAQAVRLEYAGTPAVRPARAR